MRFPAAQASSISPGTMESPARKIRAQKGVHCQISMIAMAAKAPLCDPSQSIPPIPRTSRKPVGDAEITVEDQSPDKADNGVGGRKRHDERHSCQRFEETHARLVQQERNHQAEPRSRSAIRWRRIWQSGTMTPKMCCPTGRTRNFQTRRRGSLRAGARCCSDETMSPMQISSG